MSFWKFPVCKLQSNYILIRLFQQISHGFVSRASGAHSEDHFKERVLTEDLSPGCQLAALDDIKHPSWMMIMILDRKIIF
jgi:hypothetical protein